MQIKEKLIKIGNFIKRYWYVFAIIIVIGVIASPRIIDGLTPVDTLTIKYHEQSKYIFRVGATCNDGWQSSATGRGACSHHGGVKEWKYDTAYKKSITDCRKEAEEKSWLK